MKLFSSLRKCAWTNPHGRAARTRAVADVLEGRLLLSASHGHKPPTAGPPSSTVAHPASISLSTTNWTPIGPSVSDAPGSAAGPVSGRINALAAMPGDPNTIYAAAAAGGVWKTTNGGSSWTPLTDSQSTLNSGAIAIAPSNTNIIYVGTGDPTNSTNSFYGRGVLKSTDGGTSWTLLGNSVFNRRTISQLVIDPTNPNTVYVEVSGGGIAGLNNSNTGVWKSTDGGTTWTNTTSAISSRDQYIDLKMDPSNPQHLLMAKQSGEVAGGVYQSFDGGTTWNVITGLPNTTYQSTTRIAFAPSNSQVIYASFVYNGHPLGIYSTSNGGTSWNLLPNPPDYLTGNAFYSDTLAVDPGNPNLVYVGGQSGLLQSTNGGQTWTDITTGAGGTSATHADHHAEVFDASGQLLDATDGGIWRLSNPNVGSIAWTNLNTNLQIATFFSGALNPANTNSAFAAGQDNGMAQFTGSVGWTQSDPSVDGGIVRFSQQNASRVYHLIPSFETTAGNFIRRSDDGGTTWTGVGNGIDPTERQSYLAGFAVDPANGNHIVFGTDRVYESFDGGNSWTAISNPNTNGWNVGPTVTVSNLAIAPSDPQTIYATIAGHVFVTSNDGASWTQRDPNNTPFAQIVVDQNNPQIAYAMQWAFGGKKITRTGDGGATWQDLTGNLPDLPVFSLVVNQGILYVGTDNGVYSSNDDGTTWTVFGAGMPNVQVHELDFDPVHNILAAATYGRGMWEISVAQPAPIVVNTLTDTVNPNDNLMSLREAVTAANASGQSITFDPSLAGGTINLDPANGAILVSKPISINSPSGAALTIQTNTTSIELSGNSTVRLNNLTLAGSSNALQVDLGSVALLYNGTVNGGILDNGTVNFLQFTPGSVSAMTGAGSVTKSGPASLTLTGQNTVAASLFVRSGTVVGNTDSIRGNMVVNSGATILFDQSTVAGGTGSFSGSIGGTGGVRVTGGTLQMGSNGSNPSQLLNSGPTTIDAGAKLVASAATNFTTSTILFVNGEFNLGGFNETVGDINGSGAIYNVTPIPNTATLTLGANTIGTFTGILEDTPSGSGNPGVLALKFINFANLTVAPASVANTYTGGTNMSGGGTLKGNTLGIVGAISGSGGTINFDQTLAGLGTGTFNGSLGGTNRVNINAGVVKLGPTSSITTTGQVQVVSTLIGGGVNQLGASTPYLVNGALDLGGFSQSVSTLQGAGVIYNDTADGSFGVATLNITTVSFNNSFTGLLEDHIPGSGNQGVLAVKLNGDFQNNATLSRPNTYSGGTTLAAGTINIGPSSGNPLGTGPIIFSGATTNFRGSYVNSAWQPIALTGFNRDVIVEASASDPFAGTNASFDFPIAGGNFVWYEQGFGGAAAQGTGLPPGGFITSQSNAAVSYQLQPYNANNVAAMTTTTSPVTLTLNNPQSYSKLSFLTASANGTAGFSLVLTFSDGTTESSAIQGVPDWFNGANTAFIAGGRIAREPGSQVSLTPGNPRMYEFDYALTPADIPKTLVSVKMTLNQWGTLGNGVSSSVRVFAISGTVANFQSTQNLGNAVNVFSGGPVSQNSPSIAFGDLTLENSSSFVLTASNILPGLGNPSYTFGNVTMMSDGNISPGFGEVVSVQNISDGGGGYAFTKGFSGTLVVKGTAAYGGATNVTGGVLQINSAAGLPVQSDVSVTGNGMLRLNAGTPFTAQVHLLTIAGGSQVDLGNNTLWVHFATPVNSDLSQLQTYLVNGYDGGFWDGIGSGSNGAIISSTAAANGARTTGIGYALIPNDLPDGTPGNTVVLTYDLYGDANLDHTVNSADAIILARNYLTSASTWDAGDFNYDSVVNYNDALLLQKNFNMTVAGPSNTPATNPSPTSSSSTPASLISSPPQQAVVTTTVDNAPLSPSDPKKHKDHRRRR